MTNEYLANRYGKSKAKARNQRILWITVGALLVITFFVWSIMVNFASSARLSAEIKNFDITSNQQAAVTILVSNPTKQDGVCAVRVLSTDFSVVGYKEVTVSATLGATAAIDTKVNTTYQGVSANVERCWFK
jgi:hypothetical protein